MKDLTEELIQFLDERAKPQSKGRGLPEFRMAAGSTEASIHIYDEISWWTGNDARSFQQNLAAIKADVIRVHINSPGGSVFEGVTIYNLLVAHPAKIKVRVEGLAASIASVIALAGDEVEIAENAMMMIHNPIVITLGDAEEHRRQAELLDKVKEAMLNTYEARTKMSRADLAAAMDAETWYTADESVKKGFATAKIQAARIAALWKSGEHPDFPAEAKKHSADLTATGLHMSSVLARLFSPSSEEATAQIAELGSKVGTVETALTEAAGEITNLRASVAEKETAIASLTAEKASLVAAHATALAEAKKVTKEQVSIEASRQLAATGHQPVDAGPESNEQGSNSITMAQYRAMSPRQKAEHFRSGGKLSE